MSGATTYTQGEPVSLYNSGAEVSPANPLPVSEAAQGAIAIIPGTPVVPGRFLAAVVTSAGNVTITLPDTSTMTIPFQTESGAFQTLPLGVTLLTLGTGTAGTFWNLR